MSSEVKNIVGHVNGPFVGRDSYTNCSFGVRPTRFESLFQSLSDEVKNNKYIQKSIEEIEYYETVLDGSKGLTEKLADGGFSADYINIAALKKQKYAKKAEKNKYYESAQRIDSIIFGEIKVNFETYVLPKIKANESLEEILKTTNEKVIRPMIEKIEQNGAYDDFLNYSYEDIFGMLYYLTGSCHINWKDYHALQSSI